MKTWIKGLQATEERDRSIPMAVIALLFLLTLALSLFSSTTPTFASTGTPLRGIGGKCLDVQDGNAVSKNKVQLYSCNSTTAQKWEQRKDGTLRNKGYCLDVQWGAETSGALVWLYECNGTTAQQWRINKETGTIVNPASGLCLDDQYGGTTDGNVIWIYSCNSTVSQKWNFIIPATAKNKPSATSHAPQPSSVVPKPKTKTSSPTTHTTKPAPKKPIVKQNQSSGVVKMSNSGICHAPGTTYYSKTKNFTAYSTLQKCLNAGGRMPKR